MLWSRGGECRVVRRDHGVTSTSDYVGTPGEVIHRDRVASLRCRLDGPRDQIACTGRDALGARPAALAALPARPGQLRDPLALGGLPGRQRRGSGPGGAVPARHRRRAACPAPRAPHGARERVGGTAERKNAAAAADCRAAVRGPRAEEAITCERAAIDQRGRSGGRSGLCGGWWEYSRRASSRAVGEMLRVTWPPQAATHPPMALHRIARRPRPATSSARTRSAPAHRTA